MHDKKRNNTTLNSPVSHYSRPKKWKTSSQLSTTQLLRSAESIPSFSLPFFHFLTPQTTPTPKKPIQYKKEQKKLPISHPHSNASKLSSRQPWKRISPNSPESPHSHNPPSLRDPKPAVAPPDEDSRPYLGFRQWESVRIQRKWTLKLSN